MALIAGTVRWCPSPNRLRRGPTATDKGNHKIKLSAGWRLRTKSAPSPRSQTRQRSCRRESCREASGLRPGEMATFQHRSRETPRQRPEPPHQIGLILALRSPTCRGAGARPVDRCGRSRHAVLRDAHREAPVPERTMSTLAAILRRSQLTVPHSMCLPRASAALFFAACAKIRTVDFQTAADLRLALRGPQRGHRAGSSGRSPPRHRCGSRWLWVLTHPVVSRRS